MITELWIFPVKGCQGIQVDSIDVDKRGVKGDRDFAFWANGKIIDQKCTPKLAAIAASVNDDQGILTLFHHIQGKFELKINRDSRKLESTQVLDKLHSIDQGDEVAQWASIIVGKEVRLVIPGNSWRINLPVPSLKDMHNQEKCKFFAVSSVSLLNIASLHDLNHKLENPVGVDRFRSNVVVEGLDAWEEDRLGGIYTADVEMTHMSGAERCVIITTDQKTGDRPKNNMLQTLKKYRQRPKSDRFASGLLFGNYLTVNKGGTLKIGDVFQHGTKARRVDTVLPSVKRASNRSPNTECNANAALVGTWQFTIFKTPMGNQHCDISFNLVDNNIIGEVIDSELINGASEEENVALDDCELHEKSLSFVIEIAEPFEIPLICNLEVQEELMFGTAKLGSLGAFDVKAKKCV